MVCISLHRAAGCRRFPIYRQRLRGRDNLSSFGSRLRTVHCRADGVYDHDCGEHVPSPLCLHHISLSPHKAVNGECADKVLILFPVASMQTRMEAIIRFYISLLSFWRVINDDCDATCFTHVVGWSGICFTQVSTLLGM